MTIDRQHGKIIFVCDCCEDTLEPDTRDFGEAVQSARLEH